MNSAWSSSADASWQYLAAQLAPYIKSLPVHPINNGSGIEVNTFGYSCFSNGEGGAMAYCGAYGARKMYVLGYNFE